MASPRYSVRKCGLRFEPPAVVIYYEDGKRKIHKRIMPVRNFKKTSSARRLAEELKERHGDHLNGLPVLRIEKLLRILQEHMHGHTLDECISLVGKEFAIDPEEDLNKLDDDVLNRKKDLMNETFKISSKKPGDPDFQYDVEMNFNQDDVIEASGWDSDIDNLEL